MFEISTGKSHHIIENRKAASGQATPVFYLPLSATVTARYSLNSHAPQGDHLGFIYFNENIVTFIRQDSF